MLTAVLAILALVAAVLAGAAQGKDQEELSVVTSYPPSFFEPFRKAFEAENPGIRTTIIQRNTASASRFILEKRGTSADIFWASSPDSFELLKQKGELSKIAARPTGAPEKVFRLSGQRPRRLLSRLCPVRLWHRLQRLLSGAEQAADPEKLAGSAQPDLFRDISASLRHPAPAPLT
ncbi:hypothetical protein LP421_25790 [Rhizobium sp. RCAM05350]|nr:hypothetical protein LP421_25790 [Rhizobium sp. RCAM05350]